MRKKPIVAANWKMHKTRGEAKKFIDALKEKDWSGTEVLVAPPFTSILDAKKAAERSMIKVGAQNVSEHEEGAYTGEVSAKMLKDVGAEFVIIGHSERRRYFHEKHETVRNKIENALRHGLIPMLCIGETQEERENGTAHKVIERELVQTFKGLSEEKMGSLILAYEPVWAIGTGLTATPEIAQEAHLLCREILSEIFSDAYAKARPILYGGSVKAENAGKLLEKPDIDGFLVGGASLEVASFEKILQEARGG